MHPLNPLYVMKKFLLLLAVAFALPTLAQPIVINPQTYTVPQLVNNVLINSPCAEATNITWKTGNNYNSVNGIGYFQNTNPNFPMSGGVILSTGNAAAAPGPNATHLNDGSANWPGDADLENTLAQSGITMNSVNATVLEFDFTSISPQFSFDFIFASEEYGNYQCQFSDAFAFLLTNVNTGVTTNLAVVPGSNSPISVVTIRDFLYNSSCPSENAQFFGAFNGGSAALGSASNFNGQTTVLNASAILTPNTPYHIKLVIADRGDYESDSAIFIASESLNIGQDVLGPNLTTAAQTAICSGASHVLNTSLDPATHTFKWTRNGQLIAGETGASLTITQAGTYGVTYVNVAEECQPVTDLITVQYFGVYATPAPNSLYKCDTGAATYEWNLALNTPVVSQGMDPAPIVSYYASQADAIALVNALPQMHTAAGNTTVFVRTEHPVTHCFAISSFVLQLVPAATATQPQDMVRCSTSYTQLVGPFNLGTQRNAILNGQSQVFNSVSFHISQADANTGENPLANSYNGTDGAVIYVRVQNISDTGCFATTSFTLHVSPKPLVDSLQDVVVCNNYVLPVLVNGNYFTGNNGSGTPMFAGDIISETQVIYIFNQPGGPPNCSASSNFKVTIIDPASMAPEDVIYCRRYSLPELEYGQYFATPGGTGSPIAAGTYINNSQTVYYHYTSPTAPFCTIDEPFQVTIIPTPEVGTHPDVFDCASYTLPALAVGNYYTQSNGQGQLLAAGTVISASQDVYIYADSGTTPNCPDSDGFKVNIGFDAPANISQCQPYALPNLANGNYYTGPNGTGTQIPSGTLISTSQTVYVYIQSTTNPDCVISTSFDLTISQPPVDVLQDVVVCLEYELPALTNGQYFSEPNGAGEQLFPGDMITRTRRIYIFNNSSNGCSNQSDFKVTVRGLPAIDSRDSIDNCNFYVLTQLSAGNYYTGPNGTGDLLPAGTTLTESQTVYIYSVGTLAPYCTNQNSFDIFIFPLEADAPAPIAACESYILPALTIGNYYTLPGGPHTVGNVMLSAGQAITQSTLLYIYTESGERINCIDENIFEITIYNAPVIAPISDKFVCNSYTLPALSVGNYYTGSLKSGQMLLAGDVISQNQTLYVYAETGTVPNCYNEEPFTVTIYNVPELEDVVSCDDYILPALTSGRYYSGPNATGTQLPVGYAVTSSRTIYIFGTSPFTPSCSDESSFDVTVVNPPVAHAVATAIRTTCDEDGTNDGVTDFDLSILSASLLATQTSAEFSVSYHQSMADAVANVNPVTETRQNTIFARVNNSLAPNCFDIRTLSLIINRLPEPTPVDGIICFDTETQTLLSSYVIYSNLSPSAHTFKWTNEAGEIVGTAANYTAILPGIYTLVATSNATGCDSAPADVVVSQSEPALVTYTTSSNFSDNMVVTVIATGTGDYEYKLDDGQFQDSPIFEYVASGIHQITVRDKNECGQETTTALVVNYPHFFTPNGDSINDTWNIKDLNSQTDSKISIFDRYGKFVAQIKPSGAGWDGTLNGQALPSTDYWFVVDYTENGNPREFRAHFAMKR